MPPASPPVGTPAERAIPLLLREHGGQIYALGLKLCRNPDDAEDLVQETFLRAYRKWDQFEGRSSPSTWLYTIASRACQRLHRKRAGEPTRLASLDALLPFGETTMAVVPSLDAGPEARQVLSESKELLESGMARLPVHFRLPLVLKDIIGLSLEEIAETLGLKVGTVKTRIHRARLHLRKILVARLPQEEGPPPAYSRQVCLDLLASKQDALDRGVPFPVKNEVICERCESVFSTLDLLQDLCADIAEGELPEDLHQRLLEHLTS